MELDKPDKEYEDYGASDHVHTLTVRLNSSWVSDTLRSEYQ